MKFYSVLLALFFALPLSAQELKPLSLEVFIGGSVDYLNVENDSIDDKRFDGLGYQVGLRGNIRVAEKNHFATIGGRYHNSLQSLTYIFGDTLLGQDTNYYHSYKIQRIALEVAYTYRSALEKGTVFYGAFGFMPGLLLSSKRNTDTEGKGEFLDVPSNQLWSGMSLNIGLGVEINTLSAMRILIGIDYDFALTNYREYLGESVKPNHFVLRAGIAF